MDMHRLAMIVTMSLFVILLRAFPFIVFGRRGRKAPPLLLYLGQVMSGAAIAMLVVYSLYGTTGSDSVARLEFWQRHLGAESGSIIAALLPLGIAGALTVILQIFIKNPLVSIICGTAGYMALIQNVF